MSRVYVTHSVNVSPLSSANFRVDTGMDGLDYWICRHCPERIAANQYINLDFKCMKTHLQACLGLRVGGQFIKIQWFLERAVRVFIPLPEPPLPQRPLLETSLSQRPLPAVPPSTLEERSGGCENVESGGEYYVIE